MDNREKIFARISIANKIMLTEKAVTLNRPKNDVLEEILDAFRLNRTFKLSKKEVCSVTSLEVNKKKVKELREKRKSRRVKK